MLTALFLSLVDQFSWLNVFSYLTFRGMCSVITALVLGVVLGPRLIKLLTKHQIGQVIREDDVPLHISKGGTPTMGGLLILLCVTVSTLLWANLESRFVWIALGTLFAFAAIGFADDYLKIKRKHNRGLTARQKFLLQFMTGFAVAGILYATTADPQQNYYIVPVFKDLVLDFGIWFIPVTALVLVSASNGVNLTDGLDGLATMPIVMIAAGFAVFSYVTGHFEFSNYLAIPYIEGTGELVVFCSGLIGGGLAFLFYNCHPAQIFMGDVGALSLGAVIGVVAVMVRQEVVLFIMCGIFVIETMSVILQVASFKLFGRRVWLMSPIHHHFELKGWHESKIVVRFWILSLVFVIAGLATLKIR